MFVRALKWGLVGLIVAPVALALGALGISHLAGGCGAGSSGGCEMGAFALGVYSALPAAVLLALLSIVRDLLSRRS